MYLVNKRELVHVAAYTEDSCVSIYMPTHPTDLKWQEEDPLRLKNLLQEAERQITREYPALRVPDVQRLLQPAVQLLQQGSDFWKHQNQGLAIFLAPEFNYVQSLPFPCEEQVMVSTRFYIRPLLPLFNDDACFYILTLSQNRVRLFHATRYHLNEIKLENMPTSMSEALKYDDPEKQLHFRGASAPGAAGRRAAMFYGYGEPVSYKKDSLLRYCQQVNAGLQPYLRGQNDPLVLACVDYLFPIYQEANSYPNLWPVPIIGHPDRRNSVELHRAGWNVVESHFQRGQREAVEQYWQRFRSGQTSSNVQEIVLAAYHGRVETLLTADTGQQWGIVNTSPGSIELLPEAKPGAVELINLAASYTIVNNGMVYVLPAEEVPGNMMVAAVFRY